MIKVKDGYAKLIGTTYSGSADRVLLSNGGDKAISDFAEASGVVTALGTNGNYLTWTKNGTANNLTVPYSIMASSLQGVKVSESYNTVLYYKVSNLLEKKSNYQATYIITTRTTENYYVSIGTDDGNWFLPEITRIHNNYSKITGFAWKDGVLYIKTATYNNGIQITCVNNSSGITPIISSSNASEFSSATTITIKTNIHSSNYNSYAPTLTGGGASGTWGINITGNADTVDGYHASSLWRSDGATWNPVANVVMTPTGNEQNWSFDFKNKGSYTGSHWIVWDESKSTLLKVDADSGAVSAPYGFVGNLTGNATTSSYTNYLKIQDARGTNHLPNSTTYPEKNITAWFNNTGTPDGGWWSGITVKGWTSQYAVWQLCSYSDKGTDNNYRLYHRNGINGDWGSWKTLLDSSNYSSFLDDRYYTETEVNNKLAGYLPLTGGTLTSTSVPLAIDRTSGAYSSIAYRINGTTMGILGFDTDGILVVRHKHATDANYYSVWHSGNDGASSGLDADLLDGTHKSGLLTALSSSATTNLSITVGGTTKTITNIQATYYTHLTEPTDDTFSTYISTYAKGLTVFTTSSSNIGDVPAYSTVLTIGGNVHRAFRLMGVKGGHLFYQSANGTAWGTRRQILDTGNSSVSGGGSSVGSSITVNIGGTSKTLTIPSNASTATKVYINNSSVNNTYPVIFTNTASCGTPRNDSLYVDTASGAGYNPSTNAFVASIMTAGIHNSTSTLYLDSGTATTSIIFRIGGAEKVRIAQPNGYLGVGTSEPAGRLDVNGTSYLRGDVTITASNEDRFLNFYYTGGTGYDWRIGYLGSGSGDANYFVIQSDKTDGTYVNALRIGLTSLAAVFGGTVTSSKFITSGGTSSQFVKGDGSLDSNTYATTSSLGNYLPLTGGTITGTLKIYRDAAAINYCSSGGSSHGWIGFSEADKPRVWMSNGSTSYLMWHAGNLTKVSQLSNDVGYLTSIPSHTHNYIPFEQSVNGVDMNTVKTTGFYYGYTMTNSATKNISSFIVARYSHDWGAQLQLCSSNSKAYIRYWRDSGGVMGDWKTLAYTSDIPTTMAWGNITDKPTSFTPSSHTHSYLPLSGGTLTGSENVLTLNNTSGGNIGLKLSRGSNTAWSIVATGGNLQFNELYSNTTRLILYEKSQGGSAVFTGSITATHFYESSDINLKTNIKSIFDSENCPIIRQFDWKKDGSRSYGLIAQELEAMGYSELVDGEEDGSKTVNYSAALSLIVGKLQVKIKELEKEIENLKKKN